MTGTGKLIAGNKVSYSVTIEDNGTYKHDKKNVFSLSERRTLSSL